MIRTILVVMVSLGLAADLGHAAFTTTAGFDGGADDGFSGNAFFEATGGNPDGNAHHFGSFFFNEIRTGAVGEPANAGFLGDYSSFDSVTFSVDVRVESLTNFLGDQISRTVGISLRDRDLQGPNGDSGVFYPLADISLATHGNWTTLSVTIDDPTQAALPAGWIGFGDEDPNTFEPLLPPGASFATVLAGVDEMQITGAVPGFFFTFADFDVRLDNVSVVVPEPHLLALALPVLLSLLRRRNDLCQ
jgi:hypothetical protein